MGRLVIQQFVSADGFAADDDDQFDLFEQVQRASTGFDRKNLSWIEHAGAIVLGANTYAQFVTFWPTPASAEEVVAEQINSTPKYVFSRSLTEAPWGDYTPATIESGDTAEAIRRLKREIDGDVIVWGSLTLTEALFAASEVDVVRLVVLPVAIGSGRGVFPERGNPIRMSLTSTDTFDDALVELEYTLQR